MDYDENIRSRAGQRLEDLRRSHHDSIARLRSETYRKDPRIPQLDAELRATMPQMMRLATRPDRKSREKLMALRDHNLELQRQRAELLKKQGLEPDALDDRPFCPDCRDTGWIQREMCHCLRDLCADEQTRELSRMLDLGNASFENFRLDVYDTDLDPVLQASPRNNMEVVKAYCEDYAMDFENSVPNLFLSGSPGLGKTFLSACIARAVSDQGYSVVYEMAASIFAQYEAKKFQSNTPQGEEARNAIRRYEHCDLLILDDLGSEMGSQLVTATLYELLNTRLVSGLHTVISSNIDPNDLAARYSPKVASRILGNDYRTLRFRGRDIRQFLRRNTSS